MNKYYTGVGSRKTPDKILYVMKDIATKLALQNVILRSGGAFGADKQFEYGCDLVNGKKEIYYAKDSTLETELIAASYHPAWSCCSAFARKLHGRNTLQVLGKDLKTPSKCLICWTPDGCISHKTRSIKTGGTGTSISIADTYGVKIYNLALPQHLQYWKRWLEKRDNAVLNK